MKSSVFLFFVLYSFVVIQKVDAKTVNSTFNISYNDNACGPMIISSSVSYGADIINSSTGAVLIDGQSVPVGTPLRLVPKSYTNSDINWTPYTTNQTNSGVWGNYNASTYFNNAKIVCVGNGYGGNTVDGGGYFNKYYSLYVNPSNSATYNFGGSATYNCSNTSNCTVTGPGTITASVSFNSTLASGYDGVMTTGIYGSWSPLGLVSQNSVPAKTITFNLNAVPGNCPAYSNYKLNSGSCTYTANVSQTVIGGTYNAPVTSPSGYTGSYPFICNSSGNWVANGTPTCNPPAAAPSVQIKFGLMDKIKSSIENIFAVFNVGHVFAAD